MSQEFFDAIRAGDGARVNAMLAADPGLLEAKDARGVSPFVAAKYARQQDIAAVLLERGARLDIFEACIAGDAQRVAELASGESGRAASYSHDGWTPLHLASFFDQPAILEVLMKHGADVNARSRNAPANTPLHAAAAGRSRDCVRILLEHGAEVNARQEGGWTALQAAAMNGDVEMARLLIAGGADVKARAANNQNALDLALTKGHQNMVDLLDEYASD